MSITTTISAGCSRFLRISNLFTQISSSPSPLIAQQQNMSISNTTNNAISLTRMKSRHIKVLPQTNAANTATLIFLHGSGDTGENVAEWLRMLTKNKPAFPHIKVIYPTAPYQPYTPLNGQVCDVFFACIFFAKVNFVISRSLLMCGLTGPQSIQTLTKIVLHLKLFIPI